MQDAIHHRVAQIQIPAAHVDFGAEHVAALREFARAHVLEQLQIMVHRAFAIGAFTARLGERATMRANFVSAQAVHISFPGTNQLQRELIQVFEIIGGVVQVTAPVKTEPAHIRDD